MKKNALGKGLSALIPETSVPLQGAVQDREDRYQEILASLIIPNRYQPRYTFTEEEILELAQSIKENGLIQPVSVRKIPEGKYEIISGERRFRAMRHLGYDKIPVLIKDVDTEKQMLVMAMIENLQRQNLNPVEEALGYKQLIEQYNITQDETATVMGKSRVYITNMLRLLKLEEPILDGLKSNAITAGHGKALLTIEEPSERMKLFHAIIDKGLSVREVENYARPHAKVIQKKEKKTETREYIHTLLEEKLQEKLGTKVILHPTGEGGTITIKYFSQDDLTRLAEIFKIEV